MLTLGYCKDMMAVPLASHEYIEIGLVVDEVYLITADMNKEKLVRDIAKRLGERTFKRLTINNST